MANKHSRSGTRYDSPEIDAFLDNLQSPETEAMQHALRQAKNNEMPDIQIGANDGAILKTLLTLARAKKVVELGTLSGYSALWMLQALPEDGRLWTVEYDEKHASVAREVFKHAGETERVEVIDGAAMDTLDELSSHAPFDAVFMDADKVNYHNYARWAFTNLRSGGLILADNAYFFGHLTDSEGDDPKILEAAKNMRQFHEFLAENCLSVTLPTPDGLAVAIKP